MIAATLIARDEARCIARCLDSVRPWVDRMVVLDTGSTDGTPDLARQAGAEVHHLDWLHDFSVARNRALDLADADWNLIIDADEWLDGGGDMLRAWCAGRPRLGRIRIDSVFDDAGNVAGGQVSTSQNWITRVLPRGVRFQGRVHEQADSPLPRERVDLHVLHDGYLDAQMAGKRDRNRALLERDLRDRPDDAYVLYQLGREAEGRDDFAAACEWYGKALARTPPGANWLHDLLVRTLHSLGQAGRVDDGLALAQEHMATWSESPDFYFVVGNLALDRAMIDPDAALDQWLPLAATCWGRCLEIGERPDLEGSVQGRGSHLARHNLDVLKGQMGGVAR